MLKTVIFLDGFLLFQFLENICRKKIAADLIVDLFDEYFTKSIYIKENTHC